MEEQPVQRLDYEPRNNLRMASLFQSLVLPQDNAETHKQHKRRDYQGRGHLANYRDC